MDIINIVRGTTKNVLLQNLVIEVISHTGHKTKDLKNNK